MSSPRSKKSNEQDRIADVVGRNISALIERRGREEKEKAAEERIADAVTHFTGSMLFVDLHLAIFGIWMEWINSPSTLPVP